MPAQVQAWATSTLTNAATVDDTPVIVATIGPVNVDTWGQNVRLEAVVGFTPGTDTSAVTLGFFRNTAAGTQIGIDATTAAADTIADTYNASGIGAEPVGNHLYVLVITAVDASAAGTIDSVVFTGYVGN